MRDIRDSIPHRDPILRVDGIVAGGL